MGSVRIVHPISEFDPNLLWQAETCRYVSSASGDDANDGLTQYTPMATIGAANADLALDAGSPIPVTIYVAGGVYNEALVLGMTAGGQPINVVAAPTETAWVIPPGGSVGISIDNTAPGETSWTIQGLIVFTPNGADVGLVVDDALGAGGYQVRAYRCGIQSDNGPIAASVVVDDDCALWAFDCWFDGNNAGSRGLSIGAGVVILVDTNIDGEAGAVFLDNGEGMLLMYGGSISENSGDPADWALEVVGGVAQLHGTIIGTMGDHAVRVQGGAPDEVTAGLYSCTVMGDGSSGPMFQVSDEDARLTIYDIPMLGNEGGDLFHLEDGGIVQCFSCGLFAFERVAYVEAVAKPDAQAIFVDCELESEGNGNANAVEVVGDGAAPMSASAMFYGYCSVRLNGGNGDALNLSDLAGAWIESAVINDGGGGGADISTDGTCFVALGPAPEIQQAGWTPAAGDTIFHATPEDGLTIPFPEPVGPGTFDVLGDAAAPAEGVTYQNLRSYNTLACHFTTAPTGTGNTLRITNIDQVVSVTFTITNSRFQEIAASGAFILTPGDRLLVEIIVAGGNTSGSGYFVLKE